ncbi:MAG: hypothetical protein ACOYZ7_19560 [Chloroflexota bacterium]
MQNLLNNLDAKTRLLLSLLIFVNVTLFGCLCLLLTGKMAI